MAEFIALAAEPSATTPRMRRRTSSCSILVKLSNEETKKLAMQREATVSDLRDKVREHETEDFVLIQDSKVLDLHETVGNIRGNLVEVSSTKFTVNVDGKLCNFNTATGNIKFDEFVQKLSQTSNLDIKTLKEYNYRCEGCDRCINREKQEFQVFQCDCCEEKSLTLRATVSPKTAEIAVQTLQTSFYAKFIVLYWPNECLPNLSDDAIEDSVEHFLRRMSYVKCRILITLENGRVLFENIRSSLQSLFPGSRIVTLEQWRITTDDGNEFIWAASTNDEPETNGKRDYVDCNGEVSEDTVSKLPVVRVKVEEGQPVLICGGQRRTIIQINIL